MSTEDCDTNASTADKGAKKMLKGRAKSCRAHQRPQRRTRQGIFSPLGIAGILALLMAGCGAVGTPIVTPTPIPPSPTTTLSAKDVDAIVKAALNSVSPTTMVVAVVDRAGNLLALWSKPDAPLTATG